jgi:hypothetical protein
MMATPSPIPDRTPFFTAPEGAFRTNDAEPIEEPLLDDAEEDEMADLWEMDRGNQGA